LPFRRISAPGAGTTRPSRPPTPSTRSPSGATSRIVPLRAALSREFCGRARRWRRTDHWRGSRCAGSKCRRRRHGRECLHARLMARPPPRRRKCPSPRPPPQVQPNRLNHADTLLTALPVRLCGRPQRDRTRGDDVTSCQDQQRRAQPSQRNQANGTTSPIAAITSPGAGQTSRDREHAGDHSSRRRSRG